MSNLLLFAMLFAFAFANQPAPARAQSAEALDFFAAQGCAIGPATLAAAKQAEVPKADIRALTEAAAAHPDTIHTGDWLVMPPDLCRMRFPDITSEVAITDPEVVASLSPIDEHAFSGGWGCFLDQKALVERLRAGRGWDEERANNARLRLLADGVIRGEIAYFSSNPLITPWEVQILTGKCGSMLPAIQQIREDHAFLVANFDRMIRAGAAETACTGGNLGMFLAFEEGLADMAGTTQNYWTGYQAILIARGAGWYEGASFGKIGMPRPPLCHYPADE